MTVAGTLSPFDRVWVTVMPAGSVGETVRGHSAVCGSMWRTVAVRFSPMRPLDVVTSLLFALETLVAPLHAWAQWGCLLGK